MSDMQQQQSDQDVPVTITLKVQEWNAVLNILAEGPFRIVAPLIQNITEQAQKSHPGTANARLPNGSDLRTNTPPN